MSLRIPLRALLAAMLVMPVMLLALSTTTAAAPEATAVSPSVAVESVAVVESVKAASDIYAPASGEVIEANAGLSDTPGDVNADPMGKGWFFKMKLSNKSELDGLMDQPAYEAFVKGLG